MTKDQIPSAPNVCYMHVVFYYARQPARRVAPVVAAAKEIEAAVGIRPVGYYADSDSASRPGSNWEPARGEGWTISGSIGGGAAAVTEFLGESADPLARSVLIECRRRGAHAKLVDYSWLIIFRSEESYPTSHGDAGITVTVRLDLFRRSGAAAASPRVLADRLVDIGLHAGRSYYGLVDVATLRETGASGVFQTKSDIAVAPDCLARLIERWNWEWLRESRRGYLRGVFWGNYLNADHLDRLGGKATFRDRYLTFARESLPGNQDLVTETADGGLFVRISNDPASCDATVQPIVGVRNAAWLRREFTAVDLLA